MSNQFSGEAEFAAGDVRGMRAFKIDRKNRLCGVTYEQVWEPGENESICMRGFPSDLLAEWEDSLLGPLGTYMSVTMGGGMTFSRGGLLGGGSGSWSPGGVVAAGGRSGGGQVKGWVALPDGTRHPILGPSTSAEIAEFFRETGFANPAGRQEGLRLCDCGCNGWFDAGGRRYPPLVTPCAGLDPNCSCGFYAYQRGSNDYYRPNHTTGSGNVQAVVRGYGKVVLGTRGFRAQKAQIVAICMPADVTYRNARRGNEGVYRQQMGERYGVPVFTEFDAMLRDFPLDEPEPDADDLAS
jgi:hypothetical protein